MNNRNRRKNGMKNGNTISTGNAKDARSVTNMIVSVEREATSNSDIMTGDKDSINVNALTLMSTVNLNGLNCMNNGISAQMNN